MFLSQHFFNNQSFAQNHSNFDTMQLMEKANLIGNQGSGIYTILSLGMRLEDRISNVIQMHMEEIGFAKIRMNVMQDSALWHTTGRIDSYGDELFHVHNRKQSHFVLAATGEENITHLTKQFYQNQQMNLNVYQIGNKYRDELRVRGGLLRSKEFLMKDGYSFSYDQSWIEHTYDAVRQAYCRIFDTLGLQYRIVASDNGEIGGDSSEEFIVDVDGETVEIAHIFKLGTKYSKAFDLAHHKEQYAICACYGIGITRLLAVLCALHRNDKGFFGTAAFNTYDYIISVLDSDSLQYAKDIALRLKKDGYSVLIDDRVHMSNGKQLADSELIMCHHRIICSQQGQKRGSWEHKNLQTGEIQFDKMT